MKIKIKSDRYGTVEAFVDRGDGYKTIPTKSAFDLVVYEDLKCEKTESNIVETSFLFSK